MQYLQCAFHNSGGKRGGNRRISSGGGCVLSAVPKGKSQITECTSNICTVEVKYERRSSKPSEVFPKADYFPALFFSKLRNANLHNSLQSSFSR